jgi:hypothetical protein
MFMQLRSKIRGGLLALVACGVIVLVTAQLYSQETGVTLFNALSEPSSAVMAEDQAITQSDANSIEEVKKEVLKVEDDRLQAPLNRQREVLERIYADELVWILPTGELLTKAQVLAMNIPAKPRRFSIIKEEDRRLHVYGNTVIMTAYTASETRYVGKAYNHPRRMTNVYVKLDGQWQLVAHQGTLIHTAGRRVTK